MNKEDLQRLHEKFQESTDQLQRALNGMANCLTRLEETIADFSKKLNAIPIKESSVDDFVILNTHKKGTEL